MEGDTNRCRHLSEILDDFTQAEKDDKVGIFLLYGSWNTDVSNALKQTKKSHDQSKQKQKPLCVLLRDFDVELQHHVKYQSGAVCIDKSDEEIGCLIGDGGEAGGGRNSLVPCPPEQLPCILLLIQRPKITSPRLEARYLSKFTPDQIRRWMKHRLRVDGKSTAAATPSAVTAGPHEAAKHELKSFLGDFGVLCPPTTLLSEIAPPMYQSVHDANRSAIRIFVAGDRMSVGKTSVCLGLLGSLVHLGYQPDRLAYIKPATQNEKPQLVQRYCERMGIPCVGIGPIVYYRGFTRAFLAGETESSTELLGKASHAVDELAKDKDVIVVDGVGFPAVGSICGTDNASVAIASSYPRLVEGVIVGRDPMGVLIVGGPGVGGAVDAFNLNATYFEQSKVPVLGAIFNKLSLDGFYSLENCKAAISSYFAQNEHQKNQGRQPFGFVPLFPQLSGSNCLDHVFDYIRVFKDHVDVVSLLHSAHALRETYKGASSSSTSSSSGKHNILSNDPTHQLSTTKRQKVINGYVERNVRSRDEIENSAIRAGAAPSA